MSNVGIMKRAQRSRRATVIATVRSGAERFTGHDRIELLALAADLERVHRDSALTGRQKDERFRKLMKAKQRPQTRYFRRHEWLKQS